MNDKEKRYIHIDQLVLSYQQGDEEAGQKLLQLFGYSASPSTLSNLFKLYYDLLRFGVINFRNKNTRRFLMLFIQDEAVRKAMIPFYQYSHTKREVRKITQRINDKMQFVTDEEMIQDFSYILLLLAKRFEKRSEKVYFCGYINKAFRYELFHHYRPLFKDVLFSNYTEELIEIKDENSEIALDENWLRHDLYFQNERDSLGLNWIAGKTCDFPFDQLSRFERTILSLHDDKKYTYEQIGSQLGYHRDTIWTKRKHIKTKLLEYMKNPPY